MNNSEDHHTILFNLPKNKILINTNNYIFYNNKDKEIEVNFYGILLFYINITAKVLNL